MDDEDEEEVTQPPAPAPVGDEDDISWGDALIKGELSARQRKVCELWAAGGRTQAQIAEELGYTASRVSIILSNTKAKQLVAQTRERIYEETVGSRLKKMAEPALNLIEQALTDKLNRFKKAEQLDAAKWLLEKVDGKPVQKHDIGENMLAALMDKMDALKAGGRSLSEGTIDVTPSSNTAPTPRPLLDTPPQAADPDDKFRDWVHSWDLSDTKDA